MSTSNIFMKDECYAIQGAVFDVYRELGPGFLEKVYQECLGIEFEKRNIPFVAQKELDIYYKGQKLNQYYIPDFICYDKIIIELKVVISMNNNHESQMLNYLKATGLHLGLLVDFGSFPKVGIKRLVL